MKKKNAIFWLRIVVLCLGIAVVFCFIVIGLYIFGGVGNIEDSLPWAQVLQVLWILFFGGLTVLYIHKLIEQKNQENKPDKKE